MKRFFKTISMIFIIAAVVSLIACGGKSERKGTVRLGYVEWACASASSHVVKAIIEEELGYNVNLISVSAAALWQSLETGDVDFMTTAWLPGTHADYYAAVKDSVEDLGPNFEGAKLALVVPSYVTINSLSELGANAGKFNNRIIGIDPGAGLMGITEEFIANNNLDMRLIEGSDATMAAALGDAIENEEWVVVTGWAPHWKFGRWDLKTLDDPNNEFGVTETINTIARKGLKDDMPEVYALIDNFKWESEDIATVMVWNQEDGSDPDETARRWVKENQDKVQSWLK